MSSARRRWSTCALALGLAGCPRADATTSDPTAAVPVAKEFAYAEFTVPTRLEFERTVVGDPGGALSMTVVGEISVQRQDAERLRVVATTARVENLASSGVLATGDELLERLAGAASFRVVDHAGRVLTRETAALPENVARRERLHEGGQSTAIGSPLTLPQLPPVPVTLGSEVVAEKVQERRRLGGDVEIEVDVVRRYAWTRHDEDATGDLETLQVIAEVRGSQTLEGGDRVRITYAGDEVTEVVFDVAGGRPRSMSQSTRTVVVVGETRTEQQEQSNARFHASP